MEYDDLQKIHFKQKTQSNIDQDNILMKYFGSDLNKASETTREDFDEPQQVGTLKFFIKAGISSLVIVFLSVALQTESFNKLLRFTSNGLLKKTTLYVVLFISILTVLLIGNSI